MVKERPDTRARLGQSSGLQLGCERIAGDGWQTAQDRRSFCHRERRVPCEAHASGLLSESYTKPMGSSPLVEWYRMCRRTNGAWNAFNACRA